MVGTDERARPEGVDVHAIGRVVPGGRLGSPQELSRAEPPRRQAAVAGRQRPLQPGRDAQAASRRHLIRRALREAVRQGGWAVRQRRLLAPLRRGQAQELPEHGRSRVHAERDEGCRPADLGHGGGRSRRRQLHPWPERGGAGRSGQVAGRHEHRAGLARHHHADALLQRAPRSGRRGVALPAEARLPVGQRARPRLRRQAAGVVHVVPGQPDARRGLLRRLAGRGVMGPVPARRVLARLRR